MLADAEIGHQFRLELEKLRGEMTLKVTTGKFTEIAEYREAVGYLRALNDVEGAMERAYGTMTGVNHEERDPVDYES